MIVTNTEGIAGHRVVKILGLVQGNTVRAKHAGRDIAAGLKNLVGGELKRIHGTFNRIPSSGDGANAWSGPTTWCKRGGERQVYNQRGNFWCCRALCLWNGSRRGT